MDKLLRFGGGGLGGRQYVFNPENQVSLSDNFKDMVTSTNRLPGMSGGFSNYGDVMLPSQIGTVTVTFWLYFEGAVDAQTQLDDVARMATWGRQRLVIQPQGGGRERWCWAYLNNAPLNFNVRNVPHRRMSVTLTYHVPDPHWYSYPFAVDRLDNGLTLESGAEAAGWQGYTITADTTLNITVLGSAPALPVIKVEASGTAINYLGDPGLELGQPGLVLGGAFSGTVEDFTVERVDRDTLTVTHRLAWAGTVENDDRLVIDATSEKVVYEQSGVGNVSGWPQLTRTRATMLQLEPGVNRLDISGDFTGAVLVTFEYLETWR